MTARFTKTLERSLLSLGVAVAIALVPHNHASSQVLLYQNNRTSVTFAKALPAQPLVQAVVSIGTTVLDVDRALAFYTQVLPFRKISDVGVWGTDYEHLEGAFGGRMIW